MKFIKTITWHFINVEDIYKISYYSEHKDIYSYFYLRNGEKYEVNDAGSKFQIDDDIDYIFCEWCHQKMNEIILNRIHSFSGIVYDAEADEDDAWEEFISYARNKIDKLTVYKK